ncbi:hypothetical protein O5D80_000224 [Batrachochytrium dendrobatidis]|nr:hypothetical protein O5D80_000224 [Batrachochytrium dendrobatidis]
MSNATTIYQMAKELTHTRSNGTLKLTLSSIEIVMVIICIPLFLRERNQPMIKYRSWTINILACMSATICNIADACMSMDQWVPYDYFPLIIYIRTITYIIPMCCFMPTYLRHYFLLQLPILQTKLLDYETVVSPEKYRELSKALKRTRLLSNERAAWIFFAIIFSVTMCIGLWVLHKANFDSIALSLTNDVDTFISFMSLFHVIVASVFLLSYGPRSPKENFQIMNQFYTVTALTTASLLFSVSLVFNLNPTASYVCHTLGTVLPAAAVIVDLAIPLQFLITNKRYKLELTRNSRSKSSLWLKQASNSTRSADSSQVDTIERVSTYSYNNDSPATSPTAMIPHTAIKQRKNMSYTIARIIADPTLHDAFCKYLAMEFSMESLLFIEAVKIYKEKVKESPITETVMKLSIKIAAEFIIPNSVNEVNLPKKIVLKLNTELAAALEGEFDMKKASAVYDDAAEHIEQMLALNHLRKFQTTSLFKNATASQ